MKKVLIIYENEDEIKKIKEKLGKSNYKVVLSNPMELEKKDNAFLLLEKSLDKNIAKNYERLADRMGQREKIKGIEFEKETLLLIDERKIENGEEVKIGKITNEVLQFAKKGGERNKARLFIEKKENIIRNERNIDVYDTKGFAFIPIEKNYNFLEGLEIKSKYDRKEVTKQETKEISNFLNDTIEIIKNSLIKKPKELKDFEESYEELKILLKEIEYMKSEFITFVSHEIGTPLSIIKGNIELMVEEEFGKLNNEQKKRLKTVLQNIDRLTKIIRDTMELMKIESDKLSLNKELFSITKLASEIVSEFQILARRKLHILTLNLEKYVPNIIADKDRIRQVFNNLINNAIKYTPKNGKIDVKVLKENGNVHVIVEDNGIGIPKEEQERIFEKFYKVSSHLEDASGTGLGLAICKGIVEAHDGKIWVESGKGKGATFHFILPIKPLR